ncbi:hypothetical protein L210DRAFT_2534683 [Boletus edulis BED1]|uniref:Uncharacterized protein n=1 Tax=Boletus edulis BED1 TaxID=1328754 RepID=A0AAD4BBR6_BOLED|nr:hypothetical protein L210DRAFT_2534683 [Boletus edulis BED1]
MESGKIYIQSCPPGSRVNASVRGRLDGSQRFPVVTSRLDPVTRLWILFSAVDRTVFPELLSEGKGLTPRCLHALLSAKGEKKERPGSENGWVLKGRSISTGSDIHWGNGIHTRVSLSPFVVYRGTRTQRASHF